MVLFGPPAVPAWRMGGPPLVLSLGPARVQKTGALYRDTVWGRFALTARHTNASTATLFMGVALDNPAPFPVRLAAMVLSAGGAPALILPARVLAAGDRVTWAVPVLPGGRLSLDARGSVRLDAFGLLGRLEAPVVVTVFASPALPTAPLGLRSVPRAGGVRATFPYTYASERIAAPLHGSVAMHPARWLWPSLAGVDAVDGITAWERGASAFAPRIAFVLPATHRTGARWRVVEDVPGRPPTTLLRLGSGARSGARTVDWPVPPVALAPSATLRLSAVPTAVRRR